jgi:hypothetical protein
MAHEELDAHLISLGARPRDSGIDEQAWVEADVDPATSTGRLLRWLVGRFGGSSFGASASYRHPRTGRDVLLGWILDEAEVAAARADLAEILPPDLIPFENDGADNHLLAGVGTGHSGQVFRYLHDAPTARHVELIDDSLGHFLSALHPGE